MNTLDGSKLLGTPDMKRTRDTDKGTLDSDSAVPFTARLNAYYRAVENKMENPLLIDPLAERLAGNMTEYFEKHRRFTGMGGSQIARSYYIENELLIPWCKLHETSQVILLGAGLDTRAYRLEPLQENSHTVFELDLPLIINYKDRILRDETPLCKLVRISSDLSESNWIQELRAHGFSDKIPTFWILEGLVYYIGQKQVHNLLMALSEISADDSQVFADVCVPALADLRWGPFSDHFKWGISIDQVQGFFAAAGWNVSSSYLDDHAHGKDVGQKGIILVQGVRDLSGLDSSHELSSPVESFLHPNEMQDFSRAVARAIIPEILHIIDANEIGIQQSLVEYIDFIKRNEKDIQKIAKGQENPVLLGKISPRLLGDPLTIERDAHNRTSTEIESFLVGNLQAVLSLVYCGVMGIPAEKFQGTPMDEANKKQGVDSLESLLHLIKLLQQVTEM